MIEEIGNAAGEVWRYLEENGETKFTQLKKKLILPADLLNRAIGWLAREDKLNISKQGNAVTISLK